MSKSLKEPEFGAPLPPAHPSEEAQALLWLRRSTTADCLGEPGPDDDALGAILKIAARVPDHRRVTPFRFIVFKDGARARFGAVLEGAFRANEPNADEKRIAYERDRFLRAPVVVAVVSQINPEHRTPEWEQLLSVGAACQNMLLAASAFGFAAQWITEWYAYDPAVLDALNLSGGERIAGFIYLGTAQREPLERARPVMEDKISYF